VQVDIWSGAFWQVSADCASAAGRDANAPFGDEPEPTLDDGANDGLRRAGVADRAPGGVDAGVQGRIGNDASVPHSVDQFMLTDDAASVLDQIGKHTEDLRFHRHGTLRAPEFEKLGIQSEGAESIDHGAPSF